MLILRLLLVSMISINAFASSYNDLLPHEYNFLPSTQNDYTSKIVRIQTNTGKILSFKFAEQECDPYVDNCFLSFENSDNTNFNLFGLEVCYREACKFPHPIFPNFQFILRHIHD